MSATNRMRRTARRRRAGGSSTDTDRPLCAPQIETPQSVQRRQQAGKKPHLFFLLERFFVERANAGDLEGLVALYEADATLACSDGQVVIGQEQIRQFFITFLGNRPQLSPSIQAPALCSGNLALTSSLLSNGDITAEIARRQPDGNWLWVVDQFAIGKEA